jgi:hypothetical protein
MPNFEQELAEQLSRIADALSMANATTKSKENFALSFFGMLSAINQNIGQLNQSVAGLAQNVDKLKNVISTKHSV